MKIILINLKLIYEGEKIIHENFRFELARLVATEILTKLRNKLSFSILRLCFQNLCLYLCRID